jgi:ADP-ribosylation factor related protein 1
VDRKNVELIIWDVGGQHTLRKIWEKYYGEADCIIFVVDGAD